MCVCALQTEKVDLPTRPENRAVRPTQQRSGERSVGCKNFGMCVSVHRRITESISVAG
jgi:hypothetical protein